MKSYRKPSIIPRSKSETVFGFDSPMSKKLSKDPFSVLGGNKLSKLMPVSPSGSRLPSLQNRPGTIHTQPLRKSNDTNARLPQFDLLFRPNRLKVAPKDTNKPKTPYFRIRRRDQVSSLKEIQTARTKKSEFKFEEISFGNT